MTYELTTTTARAPADTASTYAGVRCHQNRLGFGLRHVDCASDRTLLAASALETIQQTAISCGGPLSLRCPHLRTEVLVGHSETASKRVGALPLEQVTRDEIVEVGVRLEGIEELRRKAWLSEGVRPQSVLPPRGGHLQVDNDRFLEREFQSAVPNRVRLNSRGEGVGIHVQAIRRPQRSAHKLEEKIWFRRFTRRYFSNNCPQSLEVVIGRF